VDRLIDFYQGQLPLLVSFPHSGTYLPEEVAAGMTKHGNAVPDTDWFLPQLYHSPILNRCSRVLANFSRYLIDPNRPPDGANLYPGQATPGLCPTLTFSGDQIYSGDEANNIDIKGRLQQFWEPYHRQISEELARLKKEFGFAILLDAHSIASRVPRLFDGRLPDFNIGTGGGSSCAQNLAAQVHDLLGGFERYSTVLNGRFIGGYITRNYGDPRNHIHAVQLELSQATYMNEESCEYDSKKAEVVQATLQQLLELLGAREREG